MYDLKEAVLRMWDVEKLQEKLIILFFSPAILRMENILN